MEPRQGAPKLPYEGTPTDNRERQSVPIGYGEQLDEHRFESLTERPVPQEAEALPPVVPALPVAIPVIQDNSTQAVGTDDSSANPIAAADEDLIEKEWVDKAKKIIEQTKEDPYRRELEIGRLQRDYIRKRYGREIGESGD